MRGPFSTPITPLPGSFFHADPQISVQRQRNFRQFRSACDHLLAGSRRHAKDPLDGLHTAVQRLLSGKTMPPIRFSDLADYEDGRNIVVRCARIATEVLQAIYPISSALGDVSELAAFHRAIEPKSIRPSRLSYPGDRIGYRVDISRLMGAVTELEAIVADPALAAPVSAVPLGLSRIVFDHVLAFRPHLCAANTGMYLVVRYQPRNLSDYSAQASWAVVCQAEVGHLPKHFG